MALCISDVGILLDQNDDGPYKWTNDPFTIQIHAKFHNYNQPSDILNDPLEVRWDEEALICS